MVRPCSTKKQLRLLEARPADGVIRNPINVEAAAFQVGYQDILQFGREYSRMFPRRPLGEDVAPPEIGRSLMGC